MQRAGVLCLKIVKLSVSNVETSFWTCFEAAESFECCSFTVLKLILFFVTSLPVFTKQRVLNPNSGRIIDNFKEYP